ncbi:MAG: hypothetical protein HOF38_03105 [Elusimicrobiaceae bacterium]|jgi:hypothetical protein|nr:hypothetical protein [Elusimicrobiaceae bacterium]MBT3955129.1 hypothetical protein [Elusimicrobiaceae bacterium]MBT4007978.1 hypothetical protein [Elusimicrobiaceae bacterium]MBT4440314.1 hypothetical protein [Elusimicrobiaceae bacterium]MBT5987185.1 hypothetical protein [Elusimicrobiaceae bacterium]
MKTITTEVSNLLKNSNQKYFKTVTLYTRYYDTSDFDYNTGIDITDHLLDISPVKNKLDSEGYGVWKMSNTILKFSNKHNEFKTGNPDGYFTTGKIVHKSKIKIEAGIIKTDGTKESFDIFTGYIMNSPTFNPEDKSVTITISGRLATLKDYSMETLSNTATEEQLTTSDNTDFVTTNTAVGEILEVRKGTTTFADATVLRESIDFTLSNLNIYDEEAIVSLKTAAVAGDKIWATYKYWYTLKAIEWVAEQIATTAGVTGTDIEDIVFPESIKTTTTYDDETDFDTGTYDDTEYDTDAVKLDDSFPSGLGTTWTPRATPSGTYYSSSSDSVEILGNNFSGYGIVSAPQTSAYGTWDFVVDVCGTLSYEQSYYHFIADGYSLGSITSYCFSVSKTDTYDVLYILREFTNGSSANLSVILDELPIVAADLRIRISRNSSGEFYLWVRPEAPVVGTWQSQGLIATDTTITTSTYQVPVFVQYAEDNGFRDMKFSTKVATGSGDYFPDGTHTSPEIYGGTVFDSWGEVSTSETIPTGTSTDIEYRHKATSGASWGSWTALPANDIPNTTNPYLQLKWEADTNTAQDNTPELSSLSVDIFKQYVDIAMVNTKDMTCLDALIELAKMTCYEIGFNSSDEMFLKARNTDTAGAIELNSEDIYKVNYMSDGIDKIYNKVSVNFGDYRRVYDPVEDGDSSPHSIDNYGIREISVSSGNFLPPDNSNIAYAIAPLIYNYTKNIRQRATITTKFLPHLELSDILKINYDQPLISNTFSSDLDKKLSLQDVYMRIEGIEFDLENWQMKLELVEVEESS